MMMMKCRMMVTTRTAVRMTWIIVIICLLSVAMFTLNFKSSEINYAILLFLLLLLLLVVAALKLEPLLLLVVVVVAVFFAMQ